MKENLQILGGALIAFLVLDAFVFLSWIMSGQCPMGNFYLGSITAHILHVDISCSI